jgi:hypothetical protein
VTNPALSRRSFVAASAILGIGAVSKADHCPAAGSESGDIFPHQTPDFVREIVGASHRNIDRVKALVEMCPPLARASWDWGFGDWETALGAASHVGRRDIANLLIAHGARPDIFTFAMFGDLDAVKAMINARPGIQRIHGPHGIPLLQHARNGGKDATAVAEYLEGLGDAGATTPDRAISPDEIKAYSGSYRLESDGKVTFAVKDVKGRLALQRGEEGQLFLIRRGDHEFSPSGAPEVRLAFDMHEGRAHSISGRHHVTDFKATRID